MFKLISEVIELLTLKQRSEFAQLQVLVLLMTLFEVIGVISISPFMAIISDPSLIERQGILKSLYEFSAVSNHEDFIFFLGGLALVSLTISSLVSIYTVWNLAMFANRIGTDIGERLYNYYMSESWLFHTEKNSAFLIKKISIESSRLTSTILVPLMQLNARIVLVFVMSSMIFLLNPVVAVTAIAVFGMAYLFLFKIVRKKLTENSKRISRENEKRFILMSEGFGGIKDVLLLGRQREFVKRFRASGRSLADSLGSNQGLVEAPRYFMELVTFSALISLVLYLYSSDSQGISDILPLLSVYALAGFKMLPAFQQIYRSVGQIKGNITAFDLIKNEVKKSNGPIIKKESDYHLPFRKKVELKEISFSYPNKTKKVINSVDLSIPIRKTVGVVGPSGAGKSTLIDLLMGLVEPTEGGLWVDGNKLNGASLREWQNIIGYVPQSIFLSDRTFLENIAFGVSEDQISIAKVEKAVALAHLTELISELPDGLKTVVGERGVQLSGGQRQRIGIARALYHNPEVLVLDEATSALDGLTEKAIMDAINDFSGEKTIIMIAHRLKTVEKCDIIFYMEAGQVIDKGTFADLIERNEGFKKMAANA